jgi:hypothetical protein
MCQISGVCDLIQIGIVVIYYNRLILIIIFPKQWCSFVPLLTLVNTTSKQNNNSNNNNSKQSKHVYENGKYELHQNVLALVKKQQLYSSNCKRTVTRILFVMSQLCESFRIVSVFWILLPEDARKLVALEGISRSQKLYIQQIFCQLQFECEFLHFTLEAK